MRRGRSGARSSGQVSKKFRSLILQRIRGERPCSIALNFGYSNGRAPGPSLRRLTGLGESGSRTAAAPRFVGAALNANRSASSAATFWTTPSPTYCRYSLCTYRRNLSRTNGPLWVDSGGSRRGHPAAALGRFRRFRPSDPVPLGWVESGGFQSGFEAGPARRRGGTPLGRRHFIPVLRPGAILKRNETGTPA